MNENIKYYLYLKNDEVLKEESRIYAVTSSGHFIRIATEDKFSYEQSYSRAIDNIAPWITDEWIEL